MSIKKLLAGQTLSVMGTGLTERALPIVLFALSGGTTLAGTVKALAILPALFIAPVTGVWAEKAQPRALVWLNAVYAIASLMLAAGVLTKNVILITAALAIEQSVGTAFVPLYNRVLVALTVVGQSARTGQIQSVWAQTSKTVSESSAPGLVHIMGGFIFCFDALSFVLSGIIAWTLPSLPVAPPSERQSAQVVRQFWTDVKEGWSAVDHSLLVVWICALAMWMTEGTVLPAIPAAIPILGWVYAAKAMSEFVTAGIMLKQQWLYSDRALMLGGVSLGCSGILLASSSYFTNTQVMVLLSAVLAGIGAHLVGAGVPNQLYYSRPDATARVASVVTLASKLAEIASLLGATRLADTFGATIPFLGTGVCMTVATLVVFGLRALRRNR